MGADRFYITTPIYYVNDVPHLGHAYTTIAADAMSRFHRMRGTDVFFLTGTDEHGQKVAQAAAARGVSEQAHCDEMHQNFRDLWVRLEISNDAFIRTTDAQHKEQVEEALQQLWDGGWIYEQDYEGWYSVTDEMFVTDPDEIERLKAAGRVEFVRESNYFFKMSAFQERLVDAIESNALTIRPETRRNEILGFLRQPLGDLSISRPKERLSWGVELPFARDHVCYVWVDALLNYCTALRYLNPAIPADDEYGPFWPADYHLIGKDILTTHSVYWTTILMALGLPLPRNIFAHGWWTFEGEKMSKSMGNVVDPHRLIEEFGTDALRYFVLRQMPFGQDGDFAAAALVERINSDLANDMGNLASRAVNLVARDGGHFVATEHGEATAPIVAELEAAAAEFETRFADFNFAGALRRLWDALGATNKMIQDTEPWRLRNESAFDDPERRRDMFQVMMDAWEEMQLTLARSAGTLSDLNRRTLAQLEQVLPTDDARRLRQKYLQRGYTEVTMARDAARRRFDAAERLELDEATAQQVADARQGYETQLGRIVEKMLDTIDEQRLNATMFRVRLGDDGGEEEPDPLAERMDDLRDDRETLQEQTVAIIDSILGPDHVAAIERRIKDTAEGGEPEVTTTGSFVVMTATGAGGGMTVSGGSVDLEGMRFDMPTEDPYVPGRSRRRR